jgi:hypothetical protein
MAVQERPDSCVSCDVSRISSKKELICEGHKSFATCTRCKITKQGCKSKGMVALQYVTYLVNSKLLIYRDDEPFIFTTRPGMRAGRSGPRTNGNNDIYFKNYGSYEFFR